MTAQATVRLTASFEWNLGSVESNAGIERLRARLLAIPQHAELREYPTRDYLTLYARIDGIVHSLSIRHRRQISFNFEALWPVA